MKIVYRKNLDELSVSPRRARKALRDAGLYDAVQALMNDPATPPDLVDAWEYALDFQRQSPLVLGVAKALGWSEETLDLLFASASLPEG
jgi:hypothetical protein